MCIRDRGVHGAGYAAPPELDPAEAASNPKYGGYRFFAFRHVEDIRAIMEKYGDTAVSYTHLDVYKRQLSHVNHRSFYFLSTLRESRRVMEEFGDINKRLWPTEFGWGSTPSPFPGYEYEARIDEATQARWIVEAYNIMAGSGYVAVPMLWNLNYPRDTEMGAFAVAGRPAFDALRAMMGR